MFALRPWTRRHNLLPRVEKPFRWMPEEFETLFNRLLPELPLMEETTEWPYGWGTTMDDKEKEVLVRFEMPGFLPEEVKLEFLRDRLTVEAEHKEEPEKDKERVYAHVRRVVTLPPNVDLEKAEAFYRHGILEVHLPRKPEAVGRKIEVKV
jgi:HSP20 family protein